MKRITFAMVTVALMGAPATTLAQDAAVDAYGGKGGNAVLGVTETGSGNGTTGQGQAGAGQGQAGAGQGQSGTAGVNASAAPSATSSPAATATRSVPSGSLPFTGLDLALIAAGGLLLIGLGATMRRVTRPTA